jgi:hypothetical protein
MTVNTTASARRRLDPAARHAYTVPVVRELPVQVPEAATELSW